MKKAYKKPAMIVEWFTLSQTIAASCADLSDYGSPTLNRMYLCGWDLNGATTIFGKVTIIVCFRLKMDLWKMFATILLYRACSSSIPDC